MCSPSLCDLIQHSFLKTRGQRAPEGIWRGKRERRKVRDKGVD